MFYLGVLGVLGGKRQPDTRPDTRRQFIESWARNSTLTYSAGGAHVGRWGDDRRKVARGDGTVWWITGLSGAGKSTVSRLVRDGLSARGYPVLLLDGDVMRVGVR
ncbi:MAG: adenylyl-sulfate kinase [Acidobacteriota bacterium]